MSRVADIGLRVSRIAESGRCLALGAAARQSLLSVADQVVASATTFLTGVAIGRVCAKDEFGLYTLGFSLFIFVMTLQTSLILTPFMVQLPRLGAEAARRYSGSSLVHQLLFATAAAASLLAAALFIGGTSLGTVIGTVGAMLVFLLFRDYVRQLCFARLEYGRAFALDVLLMGFHFVALGILYTSGLLSAASSFIALGAASAITGLFWLGSTRDQRHFTAADVLVHFHQNWISARWLVASALIWSLGMNMYAWVVAAFHGAAMTGVWAAALGVMTLINPLMLGIQNAVGPRIMHAHARGGAVELRRVVRQTAIAFGAAVAAFSVLMLFAGEGLVMTIYGDKYSGNGALVFLLALNAAVLSVGFVVSRGLFALDLASVDFYVNCGALACFLIFGVALVRAYGPIGAAAAQLATNALATVVRTAAFARAGRVAEAAA